ncbi:hypothetical protein BGZ63DRAFT_36455 [Mariannaea sp. PMI_226]|nr:hypothetical protein BGZ63DRAFT_36455 [Mariannaea sp. PMI_226]
MSRVVKTTDFEERDYYPAPRRSAPELDEHDYRRRTVTINPPSRERERESRTPAFLREENRRTEAGPVVLRTRQIETVDRTRPRSPSPVRIREERIIRRPRSLSSSSSSEHDHEHERSRTRVIERERIREPSRKRSSSPHIVRYVERPRRSPSPVEQERELIRTRIIEREKVPSPPPAPKPQPTPPPPPPQVIRGPTIEREVITHWRDIDHGVVRARPPTPSPPPRPRAHSQVRERETDIDINLTKNHTEVDISRTTRTRSRSRERRSHYHDDDIVLRRDSEHVHFDDHSTRRRSHSAGPTPTPKDFDEEGDYLTSKIDSRGRMGEAYGGATRDWTIVDVPPGTERIKMDGVGGGSTDTTYTRYSGVRRTKFIPERDGAPIPAPAPPAPREPSPPPSRDRVRVEVFDREREIDIEKVTDRRVPRHTPQPAKDMWTEITKDLVVREAIEEMGYEYEETSQFFYIMDYLRYDDVLQLVDISDEIRRARKHRARELEWERDYQEDWERSRHRSWGPRWEEVVERDLVYDGRAPPRGYIR